MANLLMMRINMKIQIDKDGNISYEGDFPECDGINCHHSGKGLLIPYIVQNVSYHPIHGYYSVPELRWKCNRCGKII